jgi:hypothetical protein
VPSALAGEIARSDKRTRALASDEIRDNLQLIAGLLPGKDKFRMSTVNLPRAAVPIRKGID